MSSILASPGNPGISTLCGCYALDIMDPAAVLAFARAEAVDLTVVGPEAPLDQGVGDLFRREGRALLGPSRSGAALESSKVHAKHFMARHGIPTARFVVADNADDALAAVAGGTFSFPVVIKADGLAAGKGVVIAQSRGEAEAAVRAAMVDRAFGASGSRLVIEECLTGPEVSAFYLCDGLRAMSLSSAQDHKRIFDDDRGPNTGGMGAFAPSPLFTSALADFTMQRIVEPVLEGMRAEGDPYVGFLYVSLMLTPDGPKVIEFNVRFGDPEAQVVLPLIEGPIAQVFLAAAQGDLGASAITVASDRCVGVVLASRGYPASAESGQPIAGLAEAAAVPGALVFHAGTAQRDGRILTSGGRVLTVVGRGPSYRDAMTEAYRAAGAIRFDGMQMRQDIGKKALASDARRGGMSS